MRQLPLGASTRRTATPSPLASRTGCAGTQKPIDWLLSSPPSRARTLSRSQTSRARPPRHQPGRSEVHTIRWTDGRPGCVNRGSVGALKAHHVHRVIWNSMKNSLLLAALSLAFAGSVFAQTPAAVTTPGSAAAPARAAATAAGPTADLPTAPTTASGVCKDGSPFSAASTQSACRGHGGVDKKAGAPGSAPAASTVPI